MNKTTKQSTAAQTKPGKTNRALKTAAREVLKARRDEDKLGEALWSLAFSILNKGE